MLRIAFIASLFVLSACGGLSPQACLATDWQALGYEDGVAGVDNFARYHADCADHGITPNFAAYQAGHIRGVAFYCRPYNGYRVGRNGHRYNGICPAPLEPGFMSAHADGYGLYTRRAEWRRITRDLQRSKDRAVEIEHQIADSTARVATADLSPAERAALSADIVALARERGEIEVTIRDLHVAETIAAEEVAAYQNRIDHLYGS